MSKTLMSAEEWVSVLNRRLAEIGLTDRAAAALFGVSSPSLRRWKAEPDLAPHPVMRQAALDALDAYQRQR